MDYNFTNVVSGASTTTVIKASSGFLHTITVNTPVASGTLTIYNNTAASGTKIGTVTLPAVVGQPVTLIYDANENIGITIVSTIAGLDFTVSWK